MALWRRANKDKTKEWYQANKDKVKERSAKWYRENREKAKEYRAKWRAKRNAIGTAFDTTAWDRVFGLFHQ